MEKVDLVQQEFNNWIVLGDKGPKHKLREPKEFKEVEDENSLGVLVPTPYVVLDFDSLDEFATAKKIVKDLEFNCRIMETSRGGHIWFKSSEPISNNIGINTPLTLKVDVRSHGKLSYVKVKSEGEWRKWLQWDENIDEIPDMFKPTSHPIDLFNLTSGDGRNDKLYSYIITLIQKGFSKESIREIFKVINKYIFKDSMSDSELNTILRDEAFDDLRPAFFNKNKFLHHQFAEYLKSNDDVYVNENRLYVYNNGFYSDDEGYIEKRMIDYIPSLLTNQRKEVINYLKLIGDELGKSNRYIVVVNNGTLDIRKDGLKPNSPDNYVKNKIDVNYDPKAYSGVVDNTLNKIVCYDEHLRLLLEEMLGYILLPTNDFQKAFILYGEGSNGKSTLLDMITSLVGDNNVSNLSLEELNHNFKVAEITNKLVNIGDDISDKYMEDSSIFKKLVTGDEITVDKKNQQPYKIKNYATMLFASNSLPRFADKTDGLMRRLILFPFNAKFSKSDPDYDPFILDKLTSDESKSYLLNLALQGARRLFEQNGFTESKVADNLLEEYQMENNNVLVFLKHYDVKNKISKDLYNEYVFWAQDNGLQSLGIRKFNGEIRKHTDYDLKITTIGGKSCQVWS